MYGFESRPGHAWNKVEHRSGGMGVGEVDWRLASFDRTSTARIDLDAPCATPREEVPLGDARLWVVTPPFDVDRVQRGPVIAGEVDFTDTSGQVFVRPDRRCQVISSAQLSCRERRGSSSSGVCVRYTLRSRLLPGLPSKLPMMTAIVVGGVVGFT